MGNCFASKRFWVQTPFGQWNLQLPFLKYGIINSEYNTKFSQIFVFLKKGYLWPNISHFNIVLCLCGFFVLNKASATFFGENLFQNKKDIPWTIICTWTIVFIMILDFLITYKNIVSVSSAKARYRSSLVYNYIIRV